MASGHQTAQELGSVLEKQNIKLVFVTSQPIIIKCKLPSQCLRLFPIRLLIDENVKGWDQAMFRVRVSVCVYFYILKNCSLNCPNCGRNFALKKLLR